jgi:hypothetical protein
MLEGREKEVYHMAQACTGRKFFSLSSEYGHELKV